MKFTKKDFLINAERWVTDEVEDVLRINYPLNKNSIVFDVGGYQGDWAAKINDKYGCQIFIFEPVNEYYIQLLNRFFKNENIIILNAALGVEKSKKNINISNDSSSFFKKKGIKENVNIVDVADIFTLLQIDKIDLMKINIEGMEYPLLERIIELKIHHKITDIQVQFHIFIKDFEARYLAIKNELSKTHSTTYNYPFVWENFSKING